MGRLTIQEIAKVLVLKNGLEQNEANRFATELFAIIQERLGQNDLVKVKGLGTWKVITVEARESISVRTGDRVVIGEHSKITFTPDATIKELVNKPFSQFETVVLNDNVEFDDLKEDQSVDSEFDDVKDDLIEVSEEPQEEPKEEPQEEANEEPKEALIEVAAPEELTDDAPVVTEDASESEDEETNAFVDEEESNNLSKWLWMALGAIVIACLSALGGYYFGKQQTTLATIDTIVVRDTVYVPEKQDTVSMEAPKAEEPRVVEKPKAEMPKVEQPKAAPAPEFDKYALKDERVRLGAYRIVGLDHEVKVLQGQTFYSICRAHLGPDMECYIEVYNDLPRNPQIKAGQIIKIPKLQLKKRKKQ